MATPAGHPSLPNQGCIGRCEAAGIPLRGGVNEYWIRRPAGASSDLAGRESLDLDRLPGREDLNRERAPLEGGERGQPEQEALLRLRRSEREAAQGASVPPYDHAAATAAPRGENAE